MSMTSLEKFEELKKFYNDRLEELNKGAKEKEGYTSEKKYIAQVKTILKALSSFGQRLVLYTVA